MKLAGIDEAGRGSVIGPMIIACVTIEYSKFDLLLGLGVKDSKQLTPQGRLKLATPIGELATVYYSVISPKRIDNLRDHGFTLNQIELMEIAKLIQKCNADLIIIDSPYPKSGRMERMLARLLENPPELICENKADCIYPIVSAASIMAKVKRDKIISNLSRIYGKIGSGYPSDWKTQIYIKKCLNEGRLPPIVRKSWRTIRILYNSKIS